MSQGNDFANYSASAGAPATASEDVWFVAVASDDIKQMNVEQLDEAFRLGIISAQTAVWTEGMEAWAPLGEVADLGDDDGDEEPESSEYKARSEIGSGVVNASVQTASTNHAASQSHASSHGAPLHQVHQNAPLHQTHQTHQTHQSASFSGGPSSFAPVTASYAPSAPFVQSTVPVALNVDEDMPPINVGRRFKPERWLLAAAAVVGLGVTAYNNSDLFASTPAPVATAAAPAADSKPASRGYDVGGDVGAGVEKGSALPTQPASDDEPAAAKAADDAPIGASASAKEAAASTKEAPTSAADADDLKGSFTKAFNKKPAPAKPAKAAKAAKPRKAATRAPAPKPKAKAKKSSTPKASSAFDPLNDSLP